MSNPFVGEIRMFAGNFAPQGWMFCEGQLMPISENDALFNLIGTTYGGDGQSTFGLPDLRGRVPIHQSQGQFTIGEAGGAETITLTTPQLPAHTHPQLGNPGDGSAATPAGNVPAGAKSGTAYFATSPSQPMHAAAITTTGGSQPHDNMQPYLAVHFIISLFGIFPSQG